MSLRIYARTSYQRTPNACQLDTTPPTFAGIASVTPQNNGALTVAWLAATDSSPPISYEIYIALGSVNAATLFVSGNLVMISPPNTLSCPIFTLGDRSTFIVKDQLYTLGVRARDAVGNVDSNTAILTSTSIGNVDLPAVLQTVATNLQTTATALSIDQSFVLEATIHDIDVVSGSVSGDIEVSGVLTDC